MTGKSWFCRRCLEPIPAARLQAIRWASLCTKCAQVPYRRPEAAQGQPEAYTGQAFDTVIVDELSQEAWDLIKELHKGEKTLFRQIQDLTEAPQPGIINEVK